MTNGETALVDVVYQHFDRGVHSHFTFIVSHDSFFGAVEGQACSLGTGTKFRDVVETEYHVLRRHGDRCTVGRVEDVVALEHEHLRLQDGFIGKGKVDSHLVTVEVGVERSTCQGVELNGFTFNHLGLEGLDGETVKRWCTVEEHGVTFHNEFEDVPNNGITTIDDFLRTLHGLDDAAFNEFANNERFIEFCCHEFGQTAFSHFEFGTYNDYGTTRIVDTLTEEVLTETSLLTLQ